MEGDKGTLERKEVGEEYCEKQGKELRNEGRPAGKKTQTDRKETNRMKETK